MSVTVEKWCIPAALRVCAVTGARPGACAGEEVVDSIALLWRGRQRIAGIERTCGEEVACLGRETDRGVHSVMTVGAWRSWQELEKTASLVQIEHNGGKAVQ